MLHRTEQWTVRFAGLEVYRSVLHLDDDVVAELPVQRLKFQICLFGAVGIGRTVYKSAPHNDAFVRLQRICQHVGAFGMGTSEVAGTGLPFRIGFHQEAAEVGDDAVDFLNLVFPPADDFFVKRIGSAQTVESHRGCKINGEVHTQSVRAENICQCFYFLQVFGRKDFWGSVYVVQHSAVDADGSIGAGIFLISVGQCIRQFFPIPK